MHPLPMVASVSGIQSVMRSSSFLLSTWGDQPLARTLGSTRYVQTPIACTYPVPSLRLKKLTTEGVRTIAQNSSYTNEKTGGQPELCNMSTHLHIRATEAGAIIRGI